MPCVQTDQTIPTAQDVKLALAASRALAGHQTGDQSLHVKYGDHEIRMKYT
jgi:hypothetical protein